MGFKVQFQKAGVTIHQEVVHTPYDEAKRKAARLLEQRGGDIAVLTDMSTGKEYFVKR